MYNRYVPQPDGSFRRNRAGEPECIKPRPPKPEPQKPQPCPPTATPPPKQTKQEHHHAHTAKQPPQVCAEGFLRQLLPKDFDTEDLIIVLLLLLMAGNKPENRSNALLTMALYFIL